MTLPNFLIVGAAKSGTTSLYRYMEQHPGVFFPPVKEPCYFSDGLPEVAFSDSEYERLFEGAGGRKAVGEASTAYLSAPEAPARIKRLLGDIRIIIILRNPADMVYSLWGHNVYQQGEERLSFEEALEAEDDRMRSEEFRAGCRSYYGNFFYFHRGLYHEQVKRYIGTFGRKNVHVMVFEEFVKEPARHCREVFGFLGIDQGFAPALDRHNVATTFRYGFLHRLLVTPPGFAVRAYNALPLRLRIWIYMAARMVYGINITSEPRPAIDPALRKELAGRYMDDIRRLEGLIGRELSIWYGGG